MCRGLVGAIHQIQLFKAFAILVFWLLLYDCGGGPFGAIQSDLDASVEISEEGI